MKVDLIHEERFKIPIYGHNVSLIITTDIDKFCQEEGLNCNTDECKAIVICIESRIIVIFNSERLHENLIVHESFHITTQVMRLIGCTLTEESEEAYAYLLEWLYKTIRLRIIKFKEHGYTNTSKEI